MKKLALPKTRATTSYGYLTAIAKLAEEEPKRINMGLVVIRGFGLDAYLERGAGRQEPSCGTIGCVAGWTLVLAGQVEENEANYGHMAQAKELLGLTDVQQEELFMPSDLVFADDKQSVAHADKVVAHIKRFQKRYAAQLKAHKVGKAKS